MSCPDTVTLRFPRKAQYYSVARLVVGGMASPLQMSFDALDDLQSALNSLLDREDLPTLAGPDSEGGELTLQLQVSDDSMSASLGTFASGSIDGAFDRSEQDSGEFGLRRLLDTFVDEVAIEVGDGGERVTLTKRLKAVV